jgi:hypothetical protein
VEMASIGPGRAAPSQGPIRRISSEKGPLRHSPLAKNAPKLSYSTLVHPAASRSNAPFSTLAKV